MTFEVQSDHSFFFFSFLTFVVQKSRLKLDVLHQNIFFHMYFKIILSIHTAEQTPMSIGFKIDLETHLRMHKQHIYKRQKIYCSIFQSASFITCQTFNTVLYLFPQCQQYLGLQVEGFVVESLSTPLEEGTEDQTQNFYLWCVNT